MLLDEDKVTEAAQFQRQRCAAFGAMTAERIRAAKDCQFSFLPHEELARLASSWYDASAQAMLNGNYSPINTWTQVQSQLAAEERFELEDVLGLLRICRAAAIQGEKWSEDIFSVVDDAINEALRSIGGEVSWTIPSTINYMSAHPGNNEPAPAQRRAVQQQPTASRTAAMEQPEQANEPETPEPWSENWADDRRDFGRNRLKLPIRVRSAARSGSLDELTYTENVSRSGLYFMTRATSYKLQMALKVTYPYWTDLGGINRDYSAKVVRMDRMTDGSFGVATEFTESLGPRAKA